MDIKFENIPGVVKVISSDILNVECDIDLFESTCFFIKSNINGVWLIDIFAVDCSKTEPCLEIKYVFNIIEANYTFILVIKMNPNDTLKSISHFFKNASIFEQEIFEFFGVDFDREFENKFFAEDNKVFPLLKNEYGNPLPKKIDESKVFKLSTPLRKQNIKFQLEVLNDKIERCHFQNGLYHAGIEKIIEGTSIGESYSSLESFFPLSTVEWSFLLTNICENANDIEIPERAKALRMVLLELSRVQSHIIFLRDLNAYLKHDHFYQQSILWLKRLQSLFISFSGNEFFRNVIRVGGVIRDVNQSWLSRTMDEVLVLEKEILNFYKIAMSSQIWRDLLDINLVQKADSSDRSLSGPLVRAVGLNIDYRKIAPFYFYSDVDFEIPVATSGSAFDLFCVRIEEVFQSFKIVLQVLDNLPTGKCIHDQLLDLSSIKNNLNSKSESEIKSLVHNLFELKENFSGGSLIEGANGFMGMNLMVQNNKFQRMRISSNDLNLQAVFETIIRNKDVSEIELIWTMLSPNVKHIER